MVDRIPLVIQGAKGIEDVPNLSTISDFTEIRYAHDKETLAAALPGAKALLGWNFRADDLQESWHLADKLEWIHWGGAGVDAAMFPDLKNSDVVLTNSRGLFDRPMAEWTLGVMISYAKSFSQISESQRKNEWGYRLNTLMHGQRVVVVGVGSIGRQVARVCQDFGMNVSGVGRSERDGDPIFGHVYGQDELLNQLGEADYVVLITPLTPETENLFDVTKFASMKPSALFINIGRGKLVDEIALIAALKTGTIGGAALDVFCEEPLSPNNPIWSAPNTYISPHASGDYDGFEISVANLFLENFKRYRDGETLSNIVDKAHGFVPPGTK